MSAPEFGKERIVELLDELERRLADRGVALVRGRPQATRGTHRPRS
jgi:hypothetical protein